MTPEETTEGAEETQETNDTTEEEQGGEQDEQQEENQDNDQTEDWEARFHELNTELSLAPHIQDTKQRAAVRQMLHAGNSPEELRAGLQVIISLLSKGTPPQKPNPQSDAANDSDADNATEEGEDSDPIRKLIGEQVHAAIQEGLAAALSPLTANVGGDPAHKPPPRRRPATDQKETARNKALSKEVDNLLAGRGIPSMQPH